MRFNCVLSSSFRSLVIACLGLLALSACSKDEKTTAVATPPASVAEVKPTVVVPVLAPPVAAAVNCKAVIDHMVKVQEAEKKDGMINSKNAEKMTARCEKANNIKDNPEVVKCVMAADKVAALGACKDMGKLLAPW